MIAQQNPILEKAADSGNGRTALAAALRRRCLNQDF
jgi:hypothetical protein